NSCTSLTSITIPNSVTTISNYAFSGCASLTSITIPNSVTSFGDDIWTFPFSGCTGLTEINVDSGNASFSSINGVLFNKAVTSIIFYPPGKIGTYTIPSGVSTIKIFTFQGSPGLTSIIIPNSVTTIPEYAFSSCTSLTSIIIPNSVTTIPEYAFSSCTSLTSITIPNSITTIGNSGFQGCTSLTSITIPGSVASIGANAFSDCSNLSSLTIANGVTSIGYTAFAGCPLLTSITIPNSVTSIEDQAFGNSMIGPGPGTNLVSITIPEVFITALDRIGIRGPAATKALVSGIASSLATNNSFITQLSNNDSFVTAVANKILAASNNYGLATRSALNTATSTLATKTELTNALADSRVDGINSVISNPNLWTLYTTNQIKAMVMGDLMLTRTNNGQFVLNYDIEQSDNLTTWSPYQGFAMPLTNLPTDKAFVRIKLKNQQ
ncbi:MAG: leucine-rich repeat domain-containing protein, partial [Gemmataceae bacterium]